MLATKRLLHLAAAVAMASLTLQVVEAATGKQSTKATAKAKPPAQAVEKSPITFSITSRIKEGNLVVLLDGVAVFNEAFQKPPFLISQTTKWDPIEVRTGKHKLTAKVYGPNGKTYISGVYNLDVRKNGIELRIKMKGDKLTVEPAS
jgi:hypothetical protein